MIITIDGPIGTGKSSVAKKLAESIGFIFFDTGAMYRCFTYGLIKNNNDPDDIHQVKEYLDQFNFDIRVREGEKQYFVDKEDVTAKIRSEEVTSLVSKVSAIKEVREKLVQIQRDFAIGVNAVFEGRDMGTIVFPSADLKIFLTGRAEVRAQRRYDEYKEKFPEECKDLTLEKVVEDINRRDRLDSTREISPLRQAEDAHVIDTSDLDIDEVVYRILEIRDHMKTT